MKKGISVKGYFFLFPGVAVLLFVIAGGITLMVQKAKTGDNAIAAENCLGKYNTVVCHQLKINKLLSKPK